MPSPGEGRNRRAPGVDVARSLPDLLSVEALGVARRAGAVGVILAVGLLSLWPLTHGADDFPLSTYPMFSSRRPEVAWIAEAAIAAAPSSLPEARRPLSPTLVAGRGEPMQAVSTLNDAFRRGRGAMRELCREIAARSARAGETGWIHLDRVEVSVLGYFRGEAPRRRWPGARCRVPETPGVGAVEKGSPG